MEIHVTASNVSVSITGRANGNTALTSWSSDVVSLSARIAPIVSGPGFVSTQTLALEWRNTTRNVGNSPKDISGSVVLFAEVPPMPALLMSARRFAAAA